MPQFTISLQIKHIKDIVRDVPHDIQHHIHQQSKPFNRVVEMLGQLKDLCIAQDITVIAYKSGGFTQRVVSQLRVELSDRHAAQRTLLQELKTACQNFDAELELSTLDLNSRREVLDLVNFALKPLHPPSTRTPQDPYLHPSRAPAPSNAST